MNKLSVFILGVMALCLGTLVGCFPGPSVCDQEGVGRSLLCEAADDLGVKLEGVGFGLRVVNAVALANEAYTVDEVVTVLKELRLALENPISYVLFKGHVDTVLASYPGMFEEAVNILGVFSSPATMFVRDRQVLITYLDNRIAELEPG